MDKQTIVAMVILALGLTSFAIYGVKTDLYGFIPEEKFLAPECLAKYSIDIEDPLTALAITNDVRDFHRDFKCALASYEALEKIPEIRSNALLGRVEVYLYQGHPELGIPVVDMVKLEEKNPLILSNAYLTAARINYELHHYETAQEELAMAKQLNPNNPNIARVENLLRGS